MSPQKKQAIRSQRRKMKVAMAERELSVNSLAKRLRKDPAVISKAINHGHFPKVVDSLKGVLRVT